MDRKQAKEIIKNCGYIGNEVGVAFDVAVESMEKLEKIEQIFDEWENNALSIDCMVNISKVFKGC